MMKHFMEIIDAPPSHVETCKSRQKVWRVILGKMHDSSEDGQVMRRVDGNGNKYK